MYVCIHVHKPVHALTLVYYVFINIWGGALVMSQKRAARETKFQVNNFNSSKVMSILY